MLAKKGSPLCERLGTNNTTLVTQNDYRYEDDVLAVANEIQLLK